MSSEEEKKNVGSPGSGSPPAKPVKGGILKIFEKFETKNQFTKYTVITLLFCSMFMKHVCDLGSFCSFWALSVLFGSLFGSFRFFSFFLVPFLAFLCSFWFFLVLCSGSFRSVSVLSVLRGSLMYLS